MKSSGQRTNLPRKESSGKFKKKMQAVILINLCLWVSGPQTSAGRSVTQRMLKTADTWTPRDPDSVGLKV